MIRVGAAFAITANMNAELLQSGARSQGLSYQPQPRSQIMKRIAFALVLATAAVSTVYAEDATKKKATFATLVDKAGFIEHVKKHAPYPTTKKDLLAACNNAADLNDADRKYMMAKLPDGTYKTPEDVLKALNVKE
jgi:hypothetical protein